MKRRTYLSLATVGLGGCLEHNFGNREDGPDHGVVNTSSTDQSADDRDQPADDDRSLVHGDPFDDFSDLSPWAVLDGSLEASRKETRGAVLEAGTSDERVWIGRTLSEPLDCSTVAPGLTVSAENPVVPTIQLFDGDGNRADFRRGIKGNRRPLRHTFGLTTVSGPVDLSAVTQIRVALWVGDQSRTMRLDELFFVPRPETGTVTIQFDDGYETDYAEAFPILDEYEYPATSFVNPITIGSDGRLDLTQCSRLRDAGWTIGNHTYAHRRIAELSDDEQAEEIVGGQEWLVDHGFTDGPRYFAYPFGQWNQRTLELVSRHHDLAFWSGMGVNGYPANPLLCTRVGEPPAETATELLDRAARWGGHVGLFYHELEGQQLADFERTITHLHALESAGHVDVVTPTDIEKTVVG